MAAAGAEAPSDAETAPGSPALASATTEEASSFTAEAEAGGAEQAAGSSAIEEDGWGRGPPTVETAVEYIDTDGDRIEFRLEWGEVDCFVNGRLEVRHATDVRRHGRQLEVHHLVSEVAVDQAPVADRVMALFSLRCRAARLVRLVPVGMEDDGDFGVVRHLTGAGDENFKEINALSGGATLRLCGQGAGGRAAEPLSIRIAAATQQSLDEAVRLVEILIDYTGQERRECLRRSQPHNAPEGARKLRRQAREPAAVRQQNATPRPEALAGASVPSVPRPNGATAPKPAQPAEARTIPPAAAAGAVAAPRVRGLVTWFRGSFGWVASEEVAKAYGEYNVFLHKSDCDGVPRQHDVVSFELTVDERGHPKAVAAKLERLRERAPSPEKLSLDDWLRQRRR